MLILTRRAGETVVIDDRFFLTVTEKNDLGAWVSVNKTPSFVHYGELLDLPPEIAVHLEWRQGKHVAVIVDAPREIPVYRKEIWDRIKEA